MVALRTEKTHKHNTQKMVYMSKHNILHTLQWLTREKSLPFSSEVSDKILFAVTGKSSVYTTANCHSPCVILHHTCYNCSSHCHYDNTRSEMPFHALLISLLTFESLSGDGKCLDLVQGVWKCFRELTQQLWELRTLTRPLRQPCH